MIRRKSLLPKSPTRLVSITAVCLAAVFLMAWHSSGHPVQDSSPRVINQTTAFQVVQAKLEGSTLRLTLRNTSDKAINGYTLGTGGGGVLHTDYTINSFTIAPGQTEERTLSLTTLATTTGATPEIEIQAVVFTDHSFNGSVTAANSILSRREGLKTQLQTVLRLLQAPLASPDRNLRASLDQLVTQVATLPEESGGSASRQFRAGLRDAKIDARNVLQRIAAEHRAGGDADLRQRLNRLRNEIAERVNRL